MKEGGTSAHMDHPSTSTHVAFTLPFPLSLFAFAKICEPLLGTGTKTSICIAQLPMWQLQHLSLFLFVAPSSLIVSCHSMSGSAYTLPVMQIGSKKCSRCNKEFSLWRQRKSCFNCGKNEYKSCRDVVHSSPDRIALLFD